MDVVGADCGVLIFILLTMTMYSLGWLYFLWARRLLVDWQMPILTNPKSGFDDFEHAKHTTYSVKSLGCLLGINCTKPSHHMDDFFPRTGMVKYLVTLLVSLSSVAAWRRESSEEENHWHFWGSLASTGHPSRRRRRHNAASSCWGFCREWWPCAWEDPTSSCWGFYLVAWEDWIPQSGQLLQFKLLAV